MPDSQERSKNAKKNFEKSQISDLFVSIWLFCLDSPQFGWFFDVSGKIRKNTGKIPERNNSGVSEIPEK